MPVVKQSRSSNRERGKFFSQQLLLVGICCCWVAGCSSHQPFPIRQQPNSCSAIPCKLEEWQEARRVEESITRCIRWRPALGQRCQTGDFNILGEGEFHQSSVRIGVKMKTDKDPKPREVFYWVINQSRQQRDLAE